MGSFAAHLSTKLEAVENHIAVLTRELEQARVQIEMDERNLINMTTLLTEADDRALAAESALAALKARVEGLRGDADLETAIKVLECRTGRMRLDEDYGNLGNHVTALDDALGILRRLRDEAHGG